MLGDNKGTEGRIFTQKMNLVCSCLSSSAGSFALADNLLLKQGFASEFPLESSASPKMLPTELVTSYSLSFLRYLSHGQFCSNQMFPRGVTEKPVIPDDVMQLRKICVRIYIMRGVHRRGGGGITGRGEDLN